MGEGECRRLTSLKANLERRARIYEIVRGFFRAQAFLEVQTPLRVPAVAPELHIVPFRSEDWFLSTSPELHMKRLLAAGFDRLFQIAPCFRKGERGRQHNPEFAMIEWYRAGGDYTDMMRDTEDLLLAVSHSLGAGPVISYQGKKISLKPPWPRTTVRESFLRYAGWDAVRQPDALRFDLDLVEKVIPAMPDNRPVWLIDYPAEMAALARLKPGAPEVADRAEAFIGGLELANAYSELRDPAEQEKRFREEAGRIEAFRGDQAPVSRVFLDCVQHLPDCGGIALGLDRLVMLFCDASSIDEVVPFSADTA